MYLESDFEGSRHSKGGVFRAVRKINRNDKKRSQTQKKYQNASRRVRQTFIDFGTKGERDREITGEKVIDCR